MLAIFRRLIHMRIVKLMFEKIHFHIFELLELELRRGQFLIRYKCAAISCIYTPQCALCSELAPPQEYKLCCRRRRFLYHF